MKTFLPALLLAIALPVFAHAAIPARDDLQDRQSIRDMIVAEADAAGLDSNLALAVAETESGFNPDAHSSAGARGVMQIMPATARGEFGIHPDDLWDSRVNIRTGVAYLRRLLDTYDGRVDIALSHYNGGSAVRQGDALRIIPATRDYVEKVMARAGVRNEQVAWERPRAGRMLHYENGDHYINSVDAWDDDARLGVDESGRIYNADDERPVRTTDWKRYRRQSARPVYHRDARPSHERYEAPSRPWVPVSRIEARREEHAWPSVADLRAAREVEGW